ncbi:Os1348 family NHLP clan protein [Dactylosporangium sp. NBC_01737]|uniref:Os1348 family NHLP clan protein n=1 Tax=Dactylosporangium sp. NBC_01737 TaxID=2975959 RepID=UPI002E0FD9B4|nr:Os1348 family NHLP clan protein [Dactylosporangium sp. NBC_01737]
MSDFDDVLERLLTDPGFQARLAADPAGALAGYRLTADELELLQAQVGGVDAGQSRVEQRTSKASMFGLFSSIGSGIGDVVHGHGGAQDLGGGTQGSGAGQSAARGLGALEQSGGRHAAEPGAQPGGIAAHLHGAVEHGAHASAGGVEAHAGPGGAYASAGSVEAQAGGYGSAGLAEAPEPQDSGYGSAGISEAPDGPRIYASAGYGGDPQGGSGSAGIAEAPDAQGAGYGSAGIAEADPYAGQGHAGQGHVTEVHSSSQGTVYRSSTAGFGQAEGTAGFGQADGTAEGTAGFGQADGGAGSGRHGIGGALDGIEASQEGSPGGYEGGHRGGIGGALRDGLPNGAGQAPTDGYHTRVDWDGDGTWDQHTYVNRADGGVDIVVDVDGDGRAEFVGHDTDRDGLINSSEIDTNHDGVMDQRYEDLNGDGWLDRRTR